MSEQGLAERFELMLSRMAEMQAKIERLEQAAGVNKPMPKVEEPAEIIEAVQAQASSAGNPTRRRMLRRLAGGLLAGLAAGSVAATAPEAAQARLIAKAGRIGAVGAPSSIAVSGDLPASTSNYGLMGIAGTDLASFDLASSAIPGSSVGVYGRSNNYGVYGISPSGTGVSGTSPSGIGVSGYSNTYFGVYGISTSGIGVSGNSTDGYGVRGSSTSGTGVHGLSSSGFGGHFNSGRLGVAASSNGSLFSSPHATTSFGLFVNAGLDQDLAGILPGHNVALYAAAGAGGGRVAQAAYFVGNVYVAGTLGKAAGSFKIDHPLDPENKYLYHSFVESPDMLNIYNGIVRLDEEGCAEVELPDYFEALNRDFRYGLTPLDRPMPSLHIAQRIRDRKFTIGGGLPGQEVSWQVTGIRQDAYARANPIKVEEDKPEGERGRLLYQPEQVAG